MSLRLVPPSVPARSPVVLGRESELGAHDTLRHGFRCVRSEADLTKTHPLENRLSLWDATRDQLKLTMLRNTFGVHAPLRIQMERALIKQHVHTIPVMPSRNLALDILSGKDDALEPEDFLGDAKMSTEFIDPHLAMERAMGL